MKFLASLILQTAKIQLHNTETKTKNKQKKVTEKILNGFNFIWSEV